MALAREDWPAAERILGAIFAREPLDPVWPGRVVWLFTTVHLDLEARGLIRRVPGQKPLHLALVPEDTNDTLT